MKSGLRCPGLSVWDSDWKFVQDSCKQAAPRRSGCRLHKSILELIAEENYQENIRTLPCQAVILPDKTSLDDNHLTNEQFLRSLSMQPNPI